jgi:hypothetical protein
LPNAHQVKIIQLGGWNELHLVAARFNKLMIIFYMNVILLFFSITLFPNKKNLVTNNSKKIHVHNMLKTFISTLRQDYEFSIPFDIKRLNPLNLKQKERPNWQKTTSSHYHTNFTNTFQIYIYTIKLLKYN